MRSMTGFGVGEAPLGTVAGAKLTVEIRAVNHRYLDVRVRAPPLPLPACAELWSARARILHHDGPAIARGSIPRS